MVFRSYRPLQVEAQTCNRVIYGRIGSILFLADHPAVGLDLGGLTEPFLEVTQSQLRLGFQIDELNTIVYNMRTSTPF